MMSYPLFSSSNPLVGTKPTLTHLNTFENMGGGVIYGVFDANWKVFRPFSKFLMDVGGSTSENMGPRFFGHG